MAFLYLITIGNAIHALQELSNKVFLRKKFFFQEGVYKASQLEEVIVRLISQQLGISEAEARDTCGMKMHQNGEFNATPFLNVK